MAEDEETEGQAAEPGDAEQQAAFYEAFEQFFETMQARPELAAESDIMGVLFATFKAAIEETNTDKEHWLDQLKQHQDIGDALSDYLAELTDAMGGLGGSQEPGFGGLQEASLDAAVESGALSSEDLLAAFLKLQGTDPNDTPETQAAIYEAISRVRQASLEEAQEAAESAKDSPGTGVELVDLAVQAALAAADSGDEASSDAAAGATTGDEALAMQALLAIARAAGSDATAAEALRAAAESARVSAADKADHIAEAETRREHLVAEHQAQRDAAWEDMATAAGAAAASGAADAAEVEMLQEEVDQALLEQAIEQASDSTEATREHLAQMMQKVQEHAEQEQQAMRALYEQSHDAADAEGDDDTAPADEAPSEEGAPAQPAAPRRAAAAESDQEAATAAAAATAPTAGLTDRGPAAEVAETVQMAERAEQVAEKLEAIAGVTGDERLAGMGQDLTGAIEPGGLVNLGSLAEDEGLSLDRDVSDPRAGALDGITPPGEADTGEGGSEARAEPTFRGADPRLATTGGTAPTPYPNVGSSGSGSGGSHSGGSEMKRSTGDESGSGGGGIISGKTGDSSGSAGATSVSVDPATGAVKITPKGTSGGSDSGGTDSGGTDSGGSDSGGSDSGGTQGGGTEGGDSTGSEAGDYPTPSGDSAPATPHPEEGGGGLHPDAQAEFQRWAEPIVAGADTGMKKSDPRDTLVDPDEGGTVRSAADFEHRPTAEDAMEARTSPYIYPTDDQGSGESPFPAVEGSGPVSGFDPDTLVDPPKPLEGEIAGGIGDFKGSGPGQDDLEEGEELDDAT